MSPNELLRFMLAHGETCRSLHMLTGLSKSTIYRLANAKTCRYEQGALITAGFRVWRQQLMLELESI